MKYGQKEVGKPGTFEYRTYLTQDGVPISPFHDIPLWINKDQGIARMVIEIPLRTQAKLEISKKEVLNPIIQDVKNGNLRYIKDKYPFNYGAFPQTWENPTISHPDTKCKGDNDPLDVVEISDSIGITGEVRNVKILGTFAMIDNGETDWKIVCIDINDKLAGKMSDASDIETYMPGKLDEIHKFLRDYKIPDGKPANLFAYNGKIREKEFAMQVVEETFQEWKKLMRNSYPSISLTNSTLEGSPHRISSMDAQKWLEKSNL